MKAFCNELLTSIEKKLIKIRDIQKANPATTHFSFNHSKLCKINELIKNKIAIIVIDMSGIAGPVKREIGSKNNRICDIPFKLN